MSNRTNTDPEKNKDDVTITCCAEHSLILAIQHWTIAFLTAQTNLPLSSLSPENNTQKKSSSLIEISGDVMKVN